MTAKPATQHACVEGETYQGRGWSSVQTIEWGSN